MTPERRYSLSEIRQAFVDGDVDMKNVNGHRYLTVLKTRCQLCGRSPRQAGKCPRWYDALFDYAMERLMNLT